MTFKPKLFTFLHDSGNNNCVCTYLLLRTLNHRDIYPIKHFYLKLEKQPYNAFGIGKVKC